MASVIRLCLPDDNRYDPELLRLRDQDVKVETEVDRRRKRTRKGLFLPTTALPEIQAAVSRLSTARALGLWLTICAQMKMEGKEWVRVRTHLRESLGFTNRAAYGLFSTWQADKAGCT